MTSPTSSREKEADAPAARLAACAAGLAARGSLEASSQRAEGAREIAALLPPGTIDGAGEGIDLARPYSMAAQLAAPGG